MSRSFRRTCKRRYDGCSSEKTWRTLQHQTLRAKTRPRLQRFSGDDLVLPHEHEALNDRDCGKSGRLWFDVRQFPHWLRK